MTADADRPWGNRIRTRSGIYVDPLNLQPSDIRLSDVAYSLAHTNRFGGHTYEPYSVAEHSLYVASMLDRQHSSPELTLAGLLHDVPEAYLGDIPHPLKRTDAFEAYREAEVVAEMAVAEAFECWPTDHMHELVDGVDKEIVLWEMAIFRDAGLRRPPDTHSLAQSFMDRARSLFREIHGAPRTRPEAYNQ